MSEIRARGWVIRYSYVTKYHPSRRADINSIDEIGVCPEHTYEACIGLIVGDQGWDDDCLFFSPAEVNSEFEEHINNLIMEAVS